MKCRKNVANLTDEEKADLVAAFLKLKDGSESPSKIPAAATAVTNGGGTPNRYDDYVWIHNTVGGGAHLGSAFGPWHREFLRQFELDLQVASGNPHIALPYWDWTTARAAGTPGWPFTGDFLGGFGNPGPGPTTGFVTSGPFSDPAKWRINIRRGSDADSTLKRSLGVPAAADLPRRLHVLRALGVGVAAGVLWPNVYDVSPWEDPEEITVAMILPSFRKFLEYILHNGIHVWVGDTWDPDPQGNDTDGGHMSFPPVSVNDPVFWLHHCNVDRLWAIWQRTVANPTYAPQVPGSAPVGHNGNDSMINFAEASWFSPHPVLPHPNDMERHKELGYWYDTDLPDITLLTPSVSFDPGVPSPITRSATFGVRTCQPVDLEIASVTGAGYSKPVEQGVVRIVHDHAAEVVTAAVQIQFDDSVPHAVPAIGAATVVARIIDSDGYDATNPGDALVCGQWTVNLTTAVPAPVPSPDREAVIVGAAHPHGDHGDHGGGGAGHHHMDHDKMVFKMFVLDDSDELFVLEAGDIARDTNAAVVEPG